MQKRLKLIWIIVLLILALMASAFLFMLVAGRDRTPSADAHFVLKEGEYNLWNGL